MIEYKLLNKENNSSITLDNLNEVSDFITSIYPRKKVETNNMGERVRRTYGKNGSAFHIYYRDRDTRIFIPEKYNSLIKNKLESTAELRLVGVN